MSKNHNRPKEQKGKYKMSKMNKLNKTGARAIQSMKHGAKVGCATNLSRDLVATVKAAAGDSWPAALSKEPLKSAEPLLALGLLSLVAGQLADTIPAGKKITKAIDMAIEGETAQLIGKLLQGGLLGKLSTIASIAALYVDDEEAGNLSKFPASAYDDE